MKLTKEDDYICRIIRCLSTSDDYMNANYIGEKEHISKGEVLKLLQKLTKLNIVESKKGNKGGYKLIIDIKKVTLLDLVNLLNEDVSLNECLKPGVECINNKDGRCRVNKKLLQIQNKIYEELRNQTIYEVLYGE